jgi:ketosteroid isomerase-like protein
LFDSSPLKIKTMTKSIFGAIMVSVSVLLFSCTPKEKTASAVDLDKTRVQIQAMEDAYAKAEAAKDAAGVVVYYADNAISYHRNEAASNGKAAIKSYHEARFAKDTSGTHSVYKVVDLFGEGKMLVEIGSWEEINPAGAKVDSGFYMSYFEKNGDKYECVRDMSLSTKPL